MGNAESSPMPEVQRILRHPQQGEASEFYWACRNGDVERVKQLLLTTPWIDLNRLEPNGSTPLHAASFYGHSQIVGLLLREHGCRRECLNQHGLTAYEEAQSEEIRQLFHRPSEKNRFCDASDDAGNIFKVTTKAEMKEEDVATADEDFSNDQWLVGYETSEQIEHVKADFSAGKAIVQSKLLASMFGKEVFHREFTDNLNKLLTEHVPQTHREFEKCKTLIEKAFDRQQDQPEYLLRLYTLETPLYGILGNDARSLFHPLLFTLNKLKPRHFQGVSYRGVKMAEEGLRAYRWAIKSKGFIETRTFCSTTLDRSVAERFAGIGQITNDRRSVLMAFNFSENCDTAINLGKISQDLPCISEYENEAEVLMFPTTLFVVRQIESATNYITIHLENISSKPKSRLSYLKAACKNMKRNAYVKVGTKTLTDYR
ncbi:unnamed protein product [Didymodactylos carnosus]|uniref:Uncharacterized protein n=1 Tax=Didymodactylos carnosus TaxID=1234261 RepID=A0A814VB13_9BILA|nr:unnamed protein product [Didymodactylos carnosus]